MAFQLQLVLAAVAVATQMIKASLAVLDDAKDLFLLNLVFA